MGAKPSSISELQHNEVLQKFTGEIAIGNADEFWDELLAFSFQAPSNRLYGNINIMASIYIVLIIRR